MTRPHLHAALAAVLSCTATAAQTAPAAPPLPARVDHTSAQSPVKNQGRRGTCAAFAFCGALETFPGVPTDISEQLLYATLKLHQKHVDDWLIAYGRAQAIDEGDSLAAYLPLFERIGTCHEGWLPYDPNPRHAAPGTPPEIRRFLELAQLGPDALERLRDGFGKYGFPPGRATFLAGAAAQDVGTLQRALATGILAIPVGYTVHGPNWSRLDETGMHLGDGRRTIVHPGMLDRFRRPGGPWLTYPLAALEAAKAGEDFVTAYRAGRFEAAALDPDRTNYGGHAVLLIGYDERGFLAKNSWGTDWGDGGFFRIHYDYHRLYASQAVLLDAATIRPPKPDPFAKTRDIQRANYHLKVQPFGSGPQPDRMTLSTWMADPRDADVEFADYRIETRTGDGAWLPLLARRVRSIDDEVRRGLPLVVAGAELARLLAADAVRVTATYGDFVGEPTVPSNARALATRRYRAFPGSLRHTVDLAPHDG